MSSWGPLLVCCLLLQVSFLGIRNRGNRNNGFYSWDYVDLGLNSAHATKNSGLRPLGLNSEIKTSIATFDEKKLILGIDTACRKCTSQLAVIQTGGPSELLISLLDIAVHSTGTTAHPCTSWEPHWTRVKLSPSSRGDLWCAWSNHFRREHGAMTPEGASPTP